MISVVSRSADSSLIAARWACMAAGVLPPSLRAHRADRRRRQFRDTTRGPLLGRASCWVAPDIYVLGLRDAVLQYRQVVAQPHVPLIERRGVGDWSWLHRIRCVRCGPRPGCDGPEGCRMRWSEEDRDLRPPFLLFLGFEFLVGHGRRGGQAFNCCNPKSRRSGIRI